MKTIFKQLSQAWKCLTNAQILKWNALALSQEGKSVLGSKGKISGANLFMRLNYWIVYRGGEIAADPPALVGVDAPSEAINTLTGEVQLSERCRSTCVREVFLRERQDW